MNEYITKGDSHFLCWHFSRLFPHGLRLQLLLLQFCWLSSAFNREHGSEMKSNSVCVCMCVCVCAQQIAARDGKNGNNFEAISWHHQQKYTKMAKFKLSFNYCASSLGQLIYLVVFPFFSLATANIHKHTDEDINIRTHSAETAKDESGHRTFVAKEILANAKIKKCV